MVTCVLDRLNRTVTAVIFMGRFLLSSRQVFSGATGIWSMVFQGWSWASWLKMQILSPTPAPVSRTFRGEAQVSAFKFRAVLRPVSAPAGLSRGMLGSSWA